MQHIETVTVGSGGAASITFSAIPQEGFTDLLIVLSARTTGGAAGGYQTYVKLNGSTSTYSWRNLLGTGSSAVSQSSSSDSNGMRITMSSSNGDTASTFGNSSLYFPNYKSSVAKSVSGDNVSENNGTAATQTIAAGLWSGTDAITSIEIYGSGTTLAQYSSASLFGITAGSDGIVTVS